MENQNFNERGKVSESKNPEMANSAASTDNSNSGSGESPSGIRGGGTDISAGPGALGVVGAEKRASALETEETSQTENKSGKDAESNPERWPEDETMEEYLNKDGKDNSRLKPGSLNRE